MRVINGPIYKKLIASGLSISETAKSKKSKKNEIEERPQRSFGRSRSKKQLSTAALAGTLLLFPFYLGIKGRQFDVVIKPHLRVRTKMIKSAHENVNGHRANAVNRVKLIRANPARQFLGILWLECAHSFRWRSRKDPVQCMLF